MPWSHTAARASPRGDITPLLSPQPCSLCPSSKQTQHMNLSAACGLASQLVDSHGAHTGRGYGCCRGGSLQAPFLAAESGRTLLIGASRVHQLADAWALSIPRTSAILREDIHSRQSSNHHSSQNHTHSTKIHYVPMALVPHDEAMVDATLRNAFDLVGTTRHPWPNTIILSLTDWYKPCSVDVAPDSNNVSTSWCTVFSTKMDRQWWTVDANFTSHLQARLRRSCKLPSVPVSILSEEKSNASRQWAYSRERRKVCPPSLGMAAYYSDLIRLFASLERVISERLREHHEHEQQYKQSTHSQQLPMRMLWLSMPSLHFPSPSGDFDDFVARTTGSKGVHNVSSLVRSCRPHASPELARRLHMLLVSAAERAIQHASAADRLGRILSLAPVMIDLEPPEGDDPSDASLHVGLPPGRPILELDCSHYCNPSPVTWRWLNAVLNALE